MLFMTKDSKETSDLDKHIALNKIKKGSIYTFGGFLTKVSHLFKMPINKGFLKSSNSRMPINKVV